MLAHAPALTNGYVLDDRTLLADNPHVRTGAGLLELLRHELFVAAAEPAIVPYYRPLSGLLNWASFQSFGGSATLQHGLNLVLHAAVTVLVFHALRSHATRAGVAFGAALLFAVHPATAEVVAYVGGRQDMLGWMFGLCGVALVPRLRSVPGAAALGFGVTLMGALSHEYFAAQFLPLSLLVLSKGRREALPRAASVFAGGVAAVVTVLSLRAALHLIPYETHVGSIDELVRATAGVALRLLRDVVFPTDLAVNVTPLRPALVASLGLGVAAAFSAVALYRAVATRSLDAAGLTAAGLAMCALAAGLHAGVVLKYGFMSDRYAYALLVGLSLAAGAATGALLPPASENASALRSLALRWGSTALAIALIPLTWSRDESWQDERTLQEAMIESRPEDPESRLAAGMMLFFQGDLERAYPHCRAYADANPGADRANFCVGSWLLLHREPAEAARFLRPYALSRPGIAPARRAFLTALIASEQYDEAARTISGWTPAFSGPDLDDARRTLEQARGDRPGPAMK